MTTRPNRRVITFYAFKGGVGRTMTLANVAFRLADRHGLKVVAVDFDLEAPGLHSFFELSPKVITQSPGVLDYCEAWEEALRENAPAPPDPVSYLVPIEEGPGKPSQGSLRLLLAGRQDDSYDARLGRFDWKRFYSESAGAAALEHLRNTLAEHADVVLIDSRTGLTDPGGICTIQIPDAVVLMTAPNKQSIEGIERVARSIANASPEQRAGRPKATAFLCLSRVPIVEETYLTQQWFAKKQKWFADGVNAGLWEEGTIGLETHVIPQRAFYGFEEALVGRAEGTLAREPLAQAYDALAGHLVIWLVGGRDLDLTHRQLLAAALADQRPYKMHQFGRLARENITLRANLGTDEEAEGIRQALTLAAEMGYTLPDESDLRQRLIEIEAQSVPPPAPKPKRKRTKKSS